MQLLMPYMRIYVKCGVCDDIKYAYPQQFEREQ